MENHPWIVAGVVLLIIAVVAFVCILGSWMMARKRKVPYCVGCFHFLCLTCKSCMKTRGGRYIDATYHDAGKGNS